jgi:protein-tyrosine sulfotransferase
MNDQGTEPAGPAVIFTYAGSGIPRLRAILQVNPEMEWVAGVNLVQLCDRVALEWNTIDNSAGRLSALARRGIRALFQTMVAGRLADTGKRRWCTVAIGSLLEPAESFVSVFPHARFVSLHRNCTDVIYSGLAACPWGLGGTGYGFDGFAAANPGNTIAALADYWCTHTERILDVEDAHPGKCMRVLYEDLDTDPDGILGKICAFLALAPMDVVDTVGAAGVGAVGCGSEIPVERIPPQLRARVNNLMTRLGYPVLGG